MISVDRLEVGYAGRPPLLRDVTFSVPEGDLVLVVGPTGAGKSTLLRAVAERIPDAELVPQEPLEGVSGVTVEDAVRAGVARRAGGVTGAVGAAGTTGGGGRRLEEVLDLLDLAALRSCPLAELSGGQQQRVAVAAALAAGPSVLVLDEPTSALDPVAAEDVLATLHRLAHDIGTTVLVAEHRLERIVHHADTVLVVDGGTVTGPLPAADAMRHSPVRPPIVELGLALGWDPLPLSVRDARRRAASLLDRAAPDEPVAGVAQPPATPAGRDSGALVHTRSLGVVRGDVVALRDVDVELCAGEVVALMGRNGSGKSTFFDAVAGLLRPSRGHVDVHVPVLHAPQDVRRVLGANTVAAQLASSADPAHARTLLDQMAPAVDDTTAVPDLSSGQRLTLAVATVLAGAAAAGASTTGPTAGPARVVLLDEPTRGLDYAAKAALGQEVTALAAAGHAVVVATHDVELAARIATRVVVLAEGEVVTDGAARAVLTASPAFAPQVAKVVSPLPLLTTDEVLAALPQP